MVAKPNNIGVMVINIPATVVSINEKVLELTNAKGEQTQYHIGQSLVKYPDGTSEEVATRFYAKSIQAHKEVFKPEGKIMLEVQVEGDYAGRAVAKLPSNTVDVSKFLGGASVGRSTTTETDNAEGKEVTTIA